MSHLNTLQALTITLSLLVSSTTADEPLSFNSDIRPLLADRCFHCHGPDAKTREADLRLDLPQSAFEDRGGYAAIVPEDLQSSEVWARITSTDTDLLMPPSDLDKPLSADEIEKLERWIEQGAAYEDHWAYAPLSPTSPEFSDLPAPAAIDHLIRRELTKHDLTGSPPAADIVLARRLYFDLTGLPPTPKQIADFQQTAPQTRLAALVDQLLDSPHYGERMAIYWLDLVRYADTVGYHGDQDHAISPYRDWVIWAFNQDMPFDQFTRDQLAGDLLPEPTEYQLIASGYNRLLQTSHEGGVQQQEYLTKYSADRVRNFSEVWLGTTLGCAECHDHKYDPFTQKDFYSLAAIFADVNDLLSFKGTNSLPTKREPELEVHSPLDNLKQEGLVEQIAELQRRLAALPPAAEADQATGTHRDELTQQIQTLQESLTAAKQHKRRTMITRAIQPRTIRVLARGDWMDESGEIVAPAFPATLPASSLPDTEINRLELAHWLFDENAALTSRVMANRVWYLLFGQGLSRSLDDYGSQGEPPSHPELLDYLAQRLITHDWHLKPLIREIVLSETYQQSSLVTAHAREVDPDNRWLARQNRFRLPAEMVRDQALAISGLLNDEIGGPSARPYQPSGYYAHLNFPPRSYDADQNPQQYRRGVYVHWQRQFLHPMLRAFDAPTREECTAQRSISNTPLAALTLLNDPTFLEAARMLAATAMTEQGEWHDSLPATLDSLFQQVTSRKPTDAERQVIADLYAEQLDVYREHDDLAAELLAIGLAPPSNQSFSDSPELRARLAAMTFVARALLNTNEAVTRN